jgi:hypothetical protein
MEIRPIELRPQILGSEDKGLWLFDTQRRYSAGTAALPLHRTALWAASMRTRRASDVKHQGVKMAMAVPVLDGFIIELSVDTTRYWRSMAEIQCRRSFGRRETKTEDRVVVDLQNSFGLGFNVTDGVQ